LRFSAFGRRHDSQRESGLSHLVQIRYDFGVIVPEDFGMMDEYLIGLMGVPEHLIEGFEFLRVVVVACHVPNITTRSWDAPEEGLSTYFHRISLDAHD
jgi:hypothetical protein